jgi:hypothetical protein
LICDGNFCRKFTIKQRKANLRWQSAPEKYHQTRISKSAMAIRAGKVPSNKDKQICDGKSCRKFTINKEKEDCDGIQGNASCG